MNLDLKALINLLLEGKIDTILDVNLILNHSVDSTLDGILGPKVRRVKLDQGPVLPPKKGSKTGYYETFFTKNAFFLPSKVSCSWNFYFSKTEAPFCIKSVRAATPSGPIQIDPF